VQQPRKIHDELLLSVAEDHHLEGCELTTFFPMRGSKAKGELMVVGRAVNKWSGMWTVEQAKIPERRKERIDEVVAKSSETIHRCPMQWVIDQWGREKCYNTHRSAFWRVIRCVSRLLEIATDDDWPKSLIWSNLYKVAPYKGGNPSPALMSAQLEKCKLHLAGEVRLWTPKRILFLTGWDWAEPFVNSLDHVSRQERDAEVKWVKWFGTVQVPGNDSTVQVVVAVHPQGKKEAPIVKAIVESFRQLAR
jgi:hypothetical protein